MATILKIKAHYYGLCANMAANCENDATVAVRCVGLNLIEYVCESCAINRVKVS